MARDAPVVRYRLPEALRGALRDPFADIVDEATLVAAIAAGRLRPPFVTVGDIVSDTMLRHGHTPHLMVFDLATQRGGLGASIEERLRGQTTPLATVRNPPATLTEELDDAVRRALASPSPSRLLVVGEEDLATLPALVHAPLGATVIYGMPNRGLVPVPVTPEKKAAARHWLSLMKVGT